MRFLMNVNNLLLCTQLHVIKSSSQFRLCLPATGNVSSSNRLLNPVNLTESYLKPVFIQHVQTFMTSICNKSNETGKASKDEDSDGVSIYQGKYTKQILRVKLFSLSTSAMGLLAQPVLWHKGLEVSGTGLSVLLCSVAGIFTFVTPILLHFVTKKYVIDIKYNEKTDVYTSITISFFLFKNQIKFKVDEIEIPEIETMFTSIKIGPMKVPVFVDAASFHDTHHYARFMGYDKPLDFRLDVSEINKNATEKAKSTQPSNE